MKKTLLCYFFCLFIYNTLCAQVFEKRYNWNLSTNDYTYVTACEHRENGNNLIAIRQSYQTGQGAAALIEINANGDTIWEKKFNRAGTSYGENYINFIRELPNHQIFMAGGTHSSSGYYYGGLWLADSIGNILLYKQFAYNNYREITVNDIDVASDGSIYFAGNYFDLFSGGVSYYTWTVPLYGKLNIDLTLAWANTWGSTNHSNNNNNAGNAVGIKVTSDNHIIVVGSDAVDPNHGYNGTLQLAKLTPGGVIIWNKQRNLNQYTNVKHLTLDANDNIYALTYSINNIAPNNHDHIIEKYNTFGTLIWSKTIGTGWADFINKMKYNNFNNSIVLAGRFLNTNNMALFASFDTAGVPILGKYYGESSSVLNDFSDVTVFGNHYLFAGHAYTAGGLLVQTDAQGNTGCSPNDIILESVTFNTNPYSSGIYHTGINLTFADYNANYINNPITSVRTCYTCSDVITNYSINACQNYFVGGALQSTSGIYYDTLNTSAGCDSIIVTDLTIYQNPTTANAGSDQNSCGNAASINANTATVGLGMWSVISGGGIIVDINDPTTGINNLSLGENILRWTISNGSCTSSFDEVTIFVGAPSSSTLNETSCDSLTINNSTYYTSGSYMQTVQNVAGCDSTISINLIILNSSNYTFSEIACNTYSFNNQSITQSGSYSQTVQNSAGCDSLITLNLTINYADTSLITASTCNEDYIINNQTYSTTGIYTQLIQTTTGCDSTIIIDLIIHPAVDTTISLSGITLASNQTNAQYQWWNCTSNSLINGATNFDFTPINNGDYAVIINSNGCADTSACYGIYTIGIDDISNVANVLEIIPNPNGGSFSIKTNLLNAQLVITNLQGEIIYQDNLNQTINKIDLQTLPSGMYFVRLNTASENISKKIIIKK